MRLLDILWGLIWWACHPTQRKYARVLKQANEKQEYNVRMKAGEGLQKVWRRDLHDGAKMYKDFPHRFNRTPSIPKMTMRHPGDTVNVPTSNYTSIHFILHDWAARVYEACQQQDAMRLRKRKRRRRVKK